MGFAQGDEKMARLTVEQIKQRGFLKVGDEITTPLTRSQLAKELFNTYANDRVSSFFIYKKDVKYRIWAVMFDSKRIGKLNRLLENGTEIRETLNNRFDMEEGELRVVFRYKAKDIWEFLGIFKFTGEDKPNNYEQLDMPSNCYTNCYKRTDEEFKFKEEHIVWHYTRMDILEKLFPKENKKLDEKGKPKIRLRFTNSRCSKNDPLESLVLWELLRKNKNYTMKECECSEADFEDTSEKRQWLEELLESSYTFSMSDLKNSFAFWNEEYARTNGIAIGFNRETFKKSFEKSPRRIFDDVNYDIDYDIDYESSLKKVFEKVNSRYEEQKQGKSSRPTLEDILRYFSSFYKLPSWDHEKEVRATLVEVKDGNDEIKPDIEFVGNKIGRSCYEYFEQDIVCSIMLGPACSSDHIERMVRDYLKNNNYNNIDILKSNAYDLGAHK